MSYAGLSPRPRLFHTENAASNRLTSNVRGVYFFLEGLLISPGIFPALPGKVSYRSTGISRRKPLDIENEAVLVALGAYMQA